MILVNDKIGKKGVEGKARESFDNLTIKGSQLRCSNNSAEFLISVKFYYLDDMLVCRNIA